MQASGLQRTRDLQISHDGRQKPRLMAELEARIQAIEGRGWPGAVAAGSDVFGEAGGEADGGRSECVPPVRGPVRGLVRGLVRGVVQEWFGLVGSPWIPPMGVLFQLAEQSLRSTPDKAGTVAWIGRRVWPYLVPGRREGDTELLERSVFVDPPDSGSRLWAIDLAVRSKAVTAVVADGSGIDLARSRRLQLAAEAGSAVVLLARPPAELDCLSAASMRWMVSAARSVDKIPRWTVELMRCKGMRLTGGQWPEQWTLEWKRVQGDFAVPAALRERPRAADPQEFATRKTA